MNYIFLMILGLSPINIVFANEAQPAETLKSEFNNRFTPHITAEAETRNKGKFSFQRAVGANLNTNLFLSSLTYAITNRLEIGTVLITYLIENPIININFKYNFWRTERFKWSVGFSSSRGSLDNPNNDPALDDVDFTIGAVQLLFNYFPLNSKFKFGLNINSVSTSLIGLNGNEDEALELGNIVEYGADVSYHINNILDTTFGFGWLREAGVSALEKVEFGFGSSVRWYRPNKFLSSPTIGLHFSPKTETFEFLLSTSFY